MHSTIYKQILHEINTFKFDNFVITICDYSFAPISLKLCMRNDKEMYFIT